MIKGRIFLAVGVCLFLISAARAQNDSLQVNEAATEAFVRAEAGEIRLRIENQKAAFAGNVTIELLDSENIVRLEKVENRKIRSGAETYKIFMPLADLIRARHDEIAWYRLRYKVADSDGRVQSAGIVSFSEILKGVFDLSVAASDNVFAGMNFRARVRAFHPLSNLPVKNVKVKGAIDLSLEEEGATKTLKIDSQAETDSEGFAVLEFKIPPDVNPDDGNLIVTGEKYGVRREIKEDLSSWNQDFSVYLNTDKPLYQPGQDFKARGILMKGIFGASAVSPDSEIEFLIRDEEETLLYRETAKTSRFGIGNVAWQIPENAKLGTYTLEVKSGGERIGDETFKISRYDLPQFTVNVKPDRAFYLPAQMVAKVGVSAEYLFGKSVSRGKVRVVRESMREWNYSEQKWDTREENAIEGETDADGNFTAKLDLTLDFVELGGKDYRRYEDLSFAAYFTDTTTNRTEQRRFDLRLTKEAIHVYMIGENFSQNSQMLQQSLYVSTVYADGSPAVCDVEIKGIYENEAEIKTLGRLKTNQFGVGKFEFFTSETMSPAESLELKISAFDDKNQTGTHAEKIYLDTGDALQIHTKKTVYKPNEIITAQIVSTKKDALVYVDLVKDLSVIKSNFVRLKNGRAEVKLPFEPNFRGSLVIAAYSEIADKDGSFNLIKATRGVIFPAPNNLILNAKFSRDEYRPNDQAKINFRVLAPDKTPLESALGIVVFDRAIEERARADAEFGGYRGMFRSFSSALGLAENLGGLTMNDLNEIDMSKSINADLQLAAEVMLYDQSYFPQIHRSDEEARPPARDIFAKHLDKQFAPIETALKNAYLKNYAHPTDQNSLGEILDESAIDFENLRDPWAMKFRVKYEIEAENNTFNVESAGADKKFDTNDDFTVLRMSFRYFQRVGKAIDQAVFQFQRETGKFIRDEATLKSELRRQNVDLDEVKDRWNKPYKIDFGVNKRKFTINIQSRGANGVFEPRDYGTDDFDVWTNETDYFAETETRVQTVLSNFVTEKKSFPKDTEEFAEILAGGGISVEQFRDGYNQNPYFMRVVYSRFSNRIKIENTGKHMEKTTQKTTQKITLEPMAQEIVSFKLRSPGADFQKETADDFDLATFSGVISEQNKSDVKSQTKVSVVSPGAKGAIFGIIKDPTGAVIPNAEVIAASDETEEKFSVNSDEEGVYLIEYLPAGKYKITATSNGFMPTILTDVSVRAGTMTEVSFDLQVGGMSQTVDVSSGGVTTLETASSAVSYSTGSGSGRGSGNAGGGGGGGKKEEDVSKNKSGKNSTPRLREYFPETLVWQPELVTDKNGKAELKFKLGDNITSWKLYAIASDAQGKIGIAEKEVRAFQPFFADLEPPKFLTVGDEIALPVPIRNYTNAKQKVAVEMAKSVWFDFLNAPNQQIEVAPNESNNAIFNFRANTPIFEGKQKVSAIADKDSDAIEKPVTVKPNGMEIVQTNSQIFRETARFDVNFPLETLHGTGRAEIKIYPNLLAHVTESVEGLLQRPYGCGEQTISSTYPNLMILKFIKEENKLRRAAQKNLQKGYERLLGYQTADGGFSFWGASDAPDIPLTGYALRFLTDAKSFIEVDAEAVKKAQNWLLRQQRADGSWTKNHNWETAEDAGPVKLLTSYTARTLAMLPKDEKETGRHNALEKALGFLKAKNSEIGEPYALALFGLASIDAGNLEDAQASAAKLETMAKQENSGAFWNLESSTPFYGWGTAGRIETTALVVQLLVKVQSLKFKVQSQENKERSASLISLGTQFLLKNKDRYGVWHSTQTTINVLDAFLATLDAGELVNIPNKAAETFLSITLNNEKIEMIALPAGKQMTAPITLDISGKLNKSTNVLEIKSAGNSSVMAQIVATHYVGWQNFQAEGRTENDSRALRLAYDCDKKLARPTEDINCSVEAERVGFKGDGMLLTEIGLPPGADVDRASLEKARQADRNFSRYEILPDRIVVYLWARAGGTKINFKFRPRYAVNAQTAPSVIYDYYNSEAEATLPPLKFLVK